MHRRDFLQTLGAFALLPIDAVRALDSHSLARPQLLALLGPEAVRELGIRYRAATPGEDDRDVLRSTLAAGLRPSIAATVQRDFEMGRTVLVRGWILSVTEARQCALFSLTSGVAGRGRHAY